MLLGRFLETRYASYHLRRLGGEFLWVGLGQGTAAIGGILGVRFLTGALSPTSYGELALGMTLVSLIQLGPSILSGAFLRFFAPAQEEQQLSAYLHGVKVLLTQMTVILLVVAGASILGLWTFGSHEWLVLILAAFLFAILSGHNCAFDGIQNAARQRAVVAWHQGLGQWLRLFTALGFVMAFGRISGIAMLGYAVGSGIVLGSQLLFFRRRILALSTTAYLVQRSDVERWRRQMLNYAWPFATWSLFTWAQAASDRWALQTFSVTSTVGLYSVLFQLGYYPITLLTTLLVQLAAPVLFSKAGDGSDPCRMARTRQLINRLVLGSLLLTAVGTLLALALHSQVFWLLVAPEFREISYLLPWMVLSGGLFACGQVASLWVTSTSETQSLILPKIATALLGILLNVMGAYSFGLDGVLISSVAFSLTYLVWMVWLVRPTQPRGALN